MNINRDNYEVYMIDYLDGNLSREKVEELMLFLEANPGLREEAEGIEMTMPEEGENVSFDQKASLRQTDSSGENPITRENYETWFIAELENDLSLEEKDELQDFLAQNPDLKREYDLFQSARLEPDMSVTIDDKATLKSNAIEAVKGIDASNYESMMIARLEDDLTTPELFAFNEFMSKNPGLKQEFEWLRKTRLSPDKEITYPGKSKLKKFVIGVNRATIYRATAIAAGIALIIGFSWNLLFPPQVSTGQFARIERNALTGQVRAVQKETNENQNVQTSQNRKTSNASQQEKTIQREDESTLNLLASNGNTNLQVENDLRLKPDYRIYVKELYDVTPVHEEFNDGTMMAMKKTEKYPSLEELAWQKFENLTGIQKNREFDSEKENILWTAVDAGMTGINKLTGSNLSLEPDITPSGELAGYTIKSKKVQLTRER